MIPKSLATALLVFVLGGCAELVAEQPLFSVADQGLPPLQQGIWISLGEGCAEHNVRRRRFPQECFPLDIRQEEDGAWRIQMRVDLVSDLTPQERAEAEEDAKNGPYRVIFVPAVERETRDVFAPIYIGELAPLIGDATGVSYAIVAPLNEMPAGQAYIAVTIGCLDALRDGPIAGVTPRYVTRVDEQSGAESQELTDCVASSQAAVREAARRVVIENLSDLTQRRFVLVRGG